MLKQKLLVNDGKKDVYICSQNYKKNKLGLSSAKLRTQLASPARSIQLGTSLIL